MKNLYLTGFLLLFFTIPTCYSQTVFWTEDFGTGCTAGNLAGGTVTGNGTWTVNATGANAAEANVWYISAKEDGIGATNCGVDGCTSGNNDRTLHISSNPSWAGDLGAAYEIGGFCGVVVCVGASTRAESPVINCTGQSNITLSFDYLEFGDGLNDNGLLWYFDGATWGATPLIDLPKTSCCGGPCTSGSLQGQWNNFSISLPASANNNPNVKIGFEWINNDDGVGSDPSFAVDDITLTVPGGAAPVPSFTLTGPVCSGTSVSLNGSATNNPTSWSWSSNPSAGASIVSSTSQNTSVTFSAAGTYTITLTATNGSGSNSTTQAIVVNAIPTVSITPSGTVTICSGSSQNLTASGATSYTWSPATGLSCTNCTVTTANPTVNTTYMVVGSNGTCSDTDYVDIAVTSSVVATATAASTVICSGSSTTLTAGGGGTYTWTADPSLSCTNCQSPTATPTVTTTYTVTVSNGTCPTATATVVVTVTSSVTATATASSTTICSGSSSTLNATGGGTYSWAPSTGLSCTNCQSPTATPTVTTNYTVTVTSGSCPAAIASVTINVTPATVATATSSSSIICNGQSATLNATGGGTYSWAPAASLSCSNCQGPVATPSASTTYTVTVTSGTCAPATATVVVTVNNCVIPVASFTTNVDSICTGECVDFASTSTGNPTNYSWSFQNGSPTVSSSDSVQVCYYTPGTYSVQLIVQNANGADTVTNTIIVNPIPVVSVYPNWDTIIYGTSVNIQAFGGTTYNWSPDYNLSCTACSMSVASPLQNTWYYVDVANQYGCHNSDSLYIMIDLQCGEIFVPSAFSPNGDYNNDVLRVRGNCLVGMTFIVFDRWGEKVYEGTDISAGWDGTFKGKAMDAGVFYYHLIANTVDAKSYEMKGTITLIR